MKFVAYCRHHHIKWMWRISLCRDEKIMEKEYAFTKEYYRKYNWKIQNNSRQRLQNLQSIVVENQNNFHTWRIGRLSYSLFKLCFISFHITILYSAFVDELFYFENYNNSQWKYSFVFLSVVIIWKWYPENILLYIIIF